MTYSISDDCIGCGVCAKKCPEEAIEGTVKERFDIDPYLCMECGTCFDICPRSAIIDPQGRRAPQKRRRKNRVACIDNDVCAGCRNCLLNCPREAITAVKRGLFKNVYCRVDAGLCVGCRTCAEGCITGAISI
jgi:ferredoxin